LDWSFRKQSLPLSVDVESGVTLCTLSGAAAIRLPMAHAETVRTNNTAQANVDSQTEAAREGGSPCVVLDMHQSAFARSAV